MDCICRKQQDLLEKRKCGFPLETCFVFTDVKRSPRPDDVSRAQVLAMLDKAEELGLVHSVSDVVKGVYHICNCCGCCCGILRSITELGIKESIAHANYAAIIDAEECAGCGTCRERCKVAAIREDEGVCW